MLAVAARRRPPMTAEAFVGLTVVLALVDVYARYAAPVWVRGCRRRCGNIGTAAVQRVFGGAGPGHRAAHGAFGGRADVVAGGAADRRRGLARTGYRSPSLYWRPCSPTVWAGGEAGSPGGPRVVLAAGRRRQERPPWWRWGGPCWRTPSPRRSVLPPRSRHWRSPRNSAAVAPAASCPLLAIVVSMAGRGAVDPGGAGGGRTARSPPGGPGRRDGAGHCRAAACPARPGQIAGIAFAVPAHCGALVIAIPAVRGPSAGWFRPMDGHRRTDRGHGAQRSATQTAFRGSWAAVIALGGRRRRRCPYRCCAVGGRAGGLVGCHSESVAQQPHSS